MSTRATRRPGAWRGSLSLWPAVKLTVFTREAPLVSPALLHSRLRSKARRVSRALAATPVTSLATVHQKRLLPAREPSTKLGVRLLLSCDDVLVTPVLPGCTVTVSPLSEVGPASLVSVRSSSARPLTCRSRLASAVSRESDGTAVSALYAIRRSERVVGAFAVTAVAAVSSRLAPVRLSEVRCVRLPSLVQVTPLRSLPSRRSVSTLTSPAASSSLSTFVALRPVAPRKSETPKLFPAMSSRSSSVSVMASRPSVRMRVGSSSNSPAGNEVSPARLFQPRRRLLRRVRPLKSPSFSAAMPLPRKSSAVIAPRWSAVTFAQLLTPALVRMAARTCAVRLQTSATWTSGAGAAVEPLTASSRIDALLLLQFDNRVGGVDKLSRRTLLIDQPVAAPSFSSSRPVPLRSLQARSTPYVRLCFNQIRR